MERENGADAWIFITSNTLLAFWWREGWWHKSLFFKEFKTDMPFIVRLHKHYTSFWSREDW